MASQLLFPRRPADESFRQLIVKVGEHPGQFNVENGPGIAGDDFDGEYVSFGAYFGPHNPHTFAAAPEMLTVLQRVERDLTGLGAKGEPLASIRAVIAKATAS